MLKRAIAFLIGIAVFNSTAFASINQIGTGHTVRISGTIEKSNENISIEVYKGKLEENINHSTIEAMDRANYTTVLVSHDQVKSNDAGEYTYDFDVNLGSGAYTLYLATKDETLEPEQFVFVSNADFTTAISQINSPQEPEQLITVIENYNYELGLNGEDVNAEVLAPILFNTIKDYPVDINSRDISWANINKALFVYHINNGDITNIYTQNDLLSGLASSAIKDYYPMPYITEDFKIHFTSRLKSLKPNGYNDYLEKLDDAFILTTVKEPNGNQNIKNIMTAFDSEIGIDITKATDNTWISLAGKDYSNLLALKKAYNGFAMSASNPNDGFGGSGGGGAGGGGGSSSFISASTYVETNGDSKPQILPENIFVDIENDNWAKEAIVYLARKGIVSGYEDGLFRPEGFINREEFVKLVCEAFDVEEYYGDIIFNDTDENDWYMPYVKRAFNAGIIKGIGDGSFGIGKRITREDMAVMIYRAIQLKGQEFDNNSSFVFSDDFAISDYAKEAVYGLKSIGAINGITPTEFLPNENATRAQASKIIYEILSK